MKPSHSWIFIAALTTACTSLPLRDRYAALDGESKSLFLAYYPILTPLQRLAWASHMEDAERFIEAWSRDNDSFEAKLADYPAVRKGGKQYVPIALEINPETRAQISSGREIQLKAWLRYPDNRRVEATEDVTWSVQPASLASVNSGTLQFACVHSDVSVSANFLDERTGVKEIEIRKPLERLELDIQDSWKALNRDAKVLRLKSIAVCEDGSRSDVSCQADWKIISDNTEGLELRGCGNLHFAGRHAPGDQIVVRARYGKSESIWKLQLP